MLRRKPTAITITSEDIIAFEEARLRQQQQQQQQSAENMEKAGNNNSSLQTSSSGVIDPNDELKPLPGDKARIVRSREERIGISRRG
ncbi:hypothetical protein AJ80_04481 [Polytolypa hystricis UAMH7299]|uniref:Anaphase-promoting complex subunit CDC26 n=1 Tax=Polytolypa hystricis (strain UAMH7299) TaxID=1447883 RepID=A0A2B7YBT0_POLH7|nr:hypothetical protein AJ80_04481 [Polytolypa hystricis UAMH7299]